MPNPEQLIILGTGGTSVDILDAIVDINEAAGRIVCQPIGFLDDDPDKWNTAQHGIPVLGPIKSASDYPEACFINGISSPGSFRKREEIIALSGVAPERFATIVHPTASVSTMAQIGVGTVILQNATICSTAEIGHHVTVLPACIISHDCRIGDYTAIAGGACISGCVTVGRGCYIGTGCAIKEKVTIGDGALVGMGSVVLHDVPAGGVVVGNPARPLRRTEN